MDKFTVFRFRHPCLGHIQLVWCDTLAANTVGDFLFQDTFGSFDSMKAELTAASVGIQGSGWGWLGWNPATGRLKIATCPNQDPLQPTTGVQPRGAL